MAAFLATESVPSISCQQRDFQRINFDGLSAWIAIDCDAASIDIRSSIKSMDRYLVVSVTNDVSPLDPHGPTGAPSISVTFSRVLVIFLRSTAQERDFCGFNLSEHHHRAIFCALIAQSIPLIRPRNFDLRIALCFIFSSLSLSQR